MYDVHANPFFAHPKLFGTLTTILLFGFPVLYALYSAEVQNSVFAIKVMLLIFMGLLLFLTILIGKAVSAWLKEVAEIRELNDKLERS